MEIRLFTDKETCCRCGETDLHHGLQQCVQGWLCHRCALAED